MKIDKNKIIELYNNGLIDREIGEQLGVCGDAIYYHRKKMGLIANGPTKGSLIIDHQGKRKCSKCQKFLETNLFDKNKFGHVRRCCNLCRKDYRKLHYEKSKKTIEDAISYRYKYWKKRAKKENICFDIDLEYVMKIIQYQNLKCFYSGKNMLLDGNRENHNYSLSIDRVVPKLGYIKGNIVFCLHKINLIKNNMTIEEVKEWTPSFYEKIVTSSFLDLDKILG